MHNTKLAVIGIIIAVVVFAVFFAIGAKQECRDFSQKSLAVGGEVISVAVAYSTAEQITGLAGCREIPVGKGMYFPYASPTRPRFWMKGMLIPIDIVWINGDEIIGVEAAVPPLSKKNDDPPIYSPNESITAVLELAAGEAERLGLQIGTRVLFTDASDQSGD